MGGIGNFLSEIAGAYQSLMSALPSGMQNFINLFLLVLIIVIYSIFIWKFYRLIGTKNIITLNLNKYNRSEHPVFSKLVAGLFYFAEYIIILPFLIFFWFTIFTVFLILLTEGIEMSNILIISATIIGAIRMTSYIPKYGEKLSKEIAKLVPFTLLGIAITRSGFFTQGNMIAHLGQLPQFLGDVPSYLGFIILLEIILRVFDLIFSAAGVNQEVEKVKD
jgi:hypothetical protein